MKLRTLKTNSQTGVTLLLAVLVLSSLILVTLAVASLTIQEIRNSRAVITTEPALGAAETGAEAALWALKRAGSSTIPKCNGTVAGQNLGSNSSLSFCRSYTGYTYTVSNTQATVFYLYDPDGPNTDTDLSGYPYGSIRLINKSIANVLNVTVTRLDGTAINSAAINPGETQTITLPTVTAGNEGRVQISMITSGGTALVDVTTFFNGNETGLPDSLSLVSSGCSSKSVVTNCLVAGQELFARKIQVTVSRPTNPTSAPGSGSFLVDTGGTLKNNLISYWKLNEVSGTRVDSFGTNNLTDNNTVTVAAGVRGNAAQFLRANRENLSIGDNASLSSGSADFTWAGWVYMDDVNTQLSIMEKGNGSNTSAEYSLYYDENFGHFMFVTSNDGQFVLARAESNFTPTANTWYYIIVWHNSVADTVNMEINGTLIASPDNGNPVDRTGAFRMGGTGIGTTNGLNGRIDEAAFWKRVLTVQERADLYNGGSGNTYTPTGPPPPPPSGFVVDTGGTLQNSLVSYWKLDEVSGPRVDSFGTNNLTDNNTVTNANGIVGRSAQFVRANNENLSIVDNPSLSSGNASFTWAGWVDMDDLNSQVNIMQKGDGGSATTEYSLYYDENFGKFEFITSNDGQFALARAESNFTPTANTWYYIIVWHNSAGGNVFMQINNATPVGSPDNGNPVDRTGAFRMGGYGVINNGLNGRVDEAAFWKRTLTAQERTDLYNGGNGNTYSGSGQDTTAPVVTAFDVQPRTGPGAVTATFTATDTGGSHLKNAELWRATARVNCTISDNSGCNDWASVATAVGNNLDSWSGSMNNTPASGPSYIYGVHVFDNMNNMGVESAKIKVDTTVSPPAFRASAQASAASAVLTLTINKPAGTVQNDGMVASIGFRPNNAIIIPPSGWTLIRTLSNANPNNNSLATYYKVAGASEPANYSWSLNTSVGSAGGILSFSNVNTTNPVNVENGQTTSLSSYNSATPSVTATVANTMVITVHSVASSVTWTPPAGMTEVVDISSIAAPADTGEGLEINYVSQSAAGATGVKTASQDAVGGFPVADEGNSQIVVLFGP